MGPTGKTLSEDDRGRRKTIRLLRAGGGMRLLLAKHQRSSGRPQARLLEMRVNRFVNEEDIVNTRIAQH